MQLIKGKKFDENHSAMVIDVKEFIPHPNADKLKCCKVGTYNIITSIDSEPGLYVYFQKESKVNPEFLSYANLYRHSEMNSNPDKTGMFEDSGRIKVIKLRGELSEGFIIPAIEFENWIVSVTNKECKLKAGMEFDSCEDNGKTFWIIKKYVPKISQTPSISSKNQRYKVKEKLFDRIIPEQFRFHYQTTIIKKCPNVINPYDIINISEKIHGCVEANTPIKTSEGIFPIKKIVEERMPVQIEAFDINTNQKVFVPIDDYYTIPNDGDWYEIELEDGRTLKITGNNPVWLPELNCYRRAEFLNIGDSLLISD